MKKENVNDPDNLGGLGDLLPAEVLKKLNELLELLHQTGNKQQGSNNTLIYVSPGAQYVKNLYQQQTPLPNLTPTPSPKGEGKEPARKDTKALIRQSISLLMQERHGDEPLFNQQSHWQAIYRILVDKGYCRDSDFDGFDIFIRSVMPEEVNKPYRKESVKNISQTDFGKPFEQWRFDPETSKTRKPYDRMVAVAQRFKEILEENGL
jgi:hypothetical protein